MPYLGICLGMQVAVIEIARNLAGLEGAHSTEFNSTTPFPVIALITEWLNADGSVEQRAMDSDLGGTMRLGAQQCKLARGTIARKLYGKDVISERHRHRYEFNNGYRQELEDVGHEGRRDLHRRAPGGDDRAAVAPLVRRLSVPSRVHVDAALRASAVPGFHRGRPRAHANKSVERGSIGMNLCGFEVGLDRPFFLIAGTCVIEGEASALSVAGRLKEITSALGIPFIYKSSFDKANRSSHDSPRGPGLEEGLRILERVKTELDLPVLTDVHEDTPLDEVASVVDVLQTPAFLCRQTNFIQNVARAGSAGQYQEGPVPCALGHGQRGGQGTRHRQRTDHGV